MLGKRPAAISRGSPDWIFWPEALGSLTIQSLECFSNWTTGLAIRFLFHAGSLRPTTAFLKILNLLCMTSFYQYFWQRLHAGTSASSKKLRPRQLILTFPVSSTIRTLRGPPCNRCGRLLCYRTNRALDMRRLVFGCCCPSKFIRL